ncbi:hypothetical protein [Streptosporangium sp. OZ121]|uniref:hypothetical protein n=1 Tax=Streptosporangium sp. OZ121 TaxID=3444183 RepID=UPI003F79FB98
MISNAALQDTRLTLLARGLLSYLLSLPDGAKCDTASLAARFDEGKKAIDNAKALLRSLGYMTSIKRQDAKGLHVTDVNVYDVPQTGEFSQVAPTPDTPAVGQPNAGASGATPKGVKNLKKETTPPAPAADATPAPAPVEAVEAHQDGGEGIAPDDRQTLASVDLIARLALAEPRLALGQRDRATVVPLVAEWLARGVDEMHIRRILTDRLPAEVRSPVALITYRLKDKMPAVPAPRPQRVHASECPECSRPVTRPGVCSLCVAETAGKPGPVANVAQGAARARMALGLMSAA